MKATRMDVARLAGVSTATVSYVLNNKRKISEDTCRKVLAAVEQLQYKPDMIARSMATNQTMQLGIVLQSISNPFFGEIIHGFENAANAQGYFVNICTGFNKLDDYFENFIARRLDGVYISSIPTKFHMDKMYKLVEHGIPVVVSGNLLADHSRVSSLEHDYVPAMEELIDHLHRLGHRNIAFVSGLSRRTRYDLRAQGYLQALRRRGLEGENLLFDGKPPYGTDVEDGWRITRRLLESGRPFTAVICTNDLMAIGAMKALQERSLRVPQDVSVAGFDDIPFSSIWTPSLTTMSFDKAAFGARACEMLLKGIQGGSTSALLTPLHLVARNSSGVAPST